MTFYHAETLRATGLVFGGNVIRTVFTPGHEIENLFIQQDLLLAILPTPNHNALKEFLDIKYHELQVPTLIKYSEVFNKKCRMYKGKDVSIVYDKLKPSFDFIWTNTSKRHTLPQGKELLAQIRQFTKDEFNITLATSYLVQKLVDTNNYEARDLYHKMFELNPINDNDYIINTLD